MKRHTLYLLVGTVIWLTCSCQPKNEEVKREQVKPRELEEATDSVANTDKDGTATTHTFNDPEFILPQPVLQYLTKHYPGWKKPALTLQAQQQAEAQEQSPFIVNGDFDGNGKQDQVLQFQQRGNVVILAFWQLADSTLEAQELEQHKLGAQAQSPYALQLTEAGTALQNKKTGKKTTAPHEAVAVTNAGKTTIYAYTGTSFNAYTSADTTR